MATREAVRLAGSWKADLRDVRCKMEDVRGLTGVGSLLFEHELHELTRIMTDELQRKVDRAVKLIQAAGKIAEEHGQPLEVSYSGGKDSDVILELARMSGAKIRPIYKNTTIDPPGTIAHVQKMGVEILRPKETFAQLMAFYLYMV